MISRNKEFRDTALYSRYSLNYNPQTSWFPSASYSSYSAGKQLATGIVEVSVIFFHPSKQMVTY